MKKLTTFWIFIISVSCLTNSTEQADFDRFQKSIASFNNHYQLEDTISSMDDDLWNIESFIDTTFLLKYKLIDTTIKTESYNKLKSLMEYHCSLVGQFKLKKMTLLLTYSIRIAAGDGNPILTVTTISDNGKLLDFFRIDLEGIHDAFYQPTTYITVTKDFQIITTDIQKNYEEINEKLVLKDSTATTKNYNINDKGQFNLKI